MLFSSWFKRTVGCPPTFMALYRLFFFDVETHGTGCTFDDANGRVEIKSVEIFKFGLSDFTQLSAAYSPDLFTVGYARAFLDTDCLLEHVVRRCGLGDEGKSAILEDGYLRRDHGSGLLRSLLV